MCGATCNRYWQYSAGLSNSVLAGQCGLHVSGAELVKFRTGCIVRTLLNQYGAKCIPYWLDSGDPGAWCGTKCIPYWLDSADLRAWCGPCCTKYILYGMRPRGNLEEGPQGVRGSLGYSVCGACCNKHGSALEMGKVPQIMSQIKISRPNEVCTDPGSGLHRARRVQGAQ